MSVRDQVRRTVGRYEIVREVGRGATAVVYLARQTDLDRDVALKELAAFRAGDPDLLERFLRESRLAGSLSHPNIVTVFEYFPYDGTAFIAMEYFERGSLRPYVGRLDVGQVGGVLEGLLAGLAHAERRGIVHRDLKPENVMVTGEGGVKIADFGIAKAVGGSDGRSLTGSGAAVGTPAYMAPELVTDGEIGPWTDLYALGVMAYELLAGRPPFHETEHGLALMLLHAKEPVPPLASVRPDLDTELAAWVDALLAKQPRERPSGAAAAAERLDEILLAALGPRWRRAARLEPIAGVAVFDRQRRDAGDRDVADTRRRLTGRASPTRRRDLHRGSRRRARGGRGARPRDAIRPEPGRRPARPRRRRPDPQAGGAVRRRRRRADRRDRGPERPRRPSRRRRRYAWTHPARIPRARAPPSSPAGRCWSPTTSR